MERSVGEVLYYNGTRLKVTQQKGCKGCYFQDGTRGNCGLGAIRDIIGMCDMRHRDDFMPVIFQEVHPRKHIKFNFK